MNTIKLTDSKQNEILLEDIETLLSILNKWKNLESQVVLVEKSEFGVFTIGIGPKYGFIEFMDNSLAPPYLLAKAMEPQVDIHEPLMFNAADTPTPIPAQFCLDIDIILKVLIDALRANKLPDYVEWKEV